MAQLRTGSTAGGYRIATDNEIGNLATLSTDSKKTIVEAINEIYSGGGNSGIVVLSSIDADLDYEDIDIEFPMVLIYVKSLYGVSGGSLGFGQTTYGGGTYIKLPTFDVEYDLDNKNIRLALPQEYQGIYNVTKTKPGRYELADSLSDNNIIVTLL